LSQATSDSAERRAAAISHFLSMMSPSGFQFVGIRDAITGSRKKKFPAPNFVTGEELHFSRISFTAGGTN
jgi:hypothetical protein